MIRIVTDYLDEAVKVCPEKIAYGDTRETVTYHELWERSQKVKKYIESLGICRNSVAVYMDKSVKCIVAMLGIMYSGNHYTVLDISTPDERIEKIIDVLKPKLFFYEERKPDIIVKDCIIEKIDIVENYDVLDSENKEKNTTIPSDTAMISFTSGSTGVPKGVVISHRAIIHSTESRTRYFGYNENDIFANQFPFYFIGHLADIYCTLKCKATDYIIPKSMFFFPTQVIEYIEKNQVTVLDWVAPALLLISKSGALQGVHNGRIRSVAFGGEQLSPMVINLWQQYLPNATFFNAYGSTETANGCIFYRISKNNREIEHKKIPLGYPFDGVDVYLLDDNNCLVKKGDIGRLCIATEQLADGYFMNKNETASRFLEINIKGKAERIYDTGDMAFENENGELENAGRRDFMINRYGYRIELGDIEHTAMSLMGGLEVACIYNKDSEKIELFYSGSIEEATVQKTLKKSLPPYMIPDMIIHIDNMPRNANGKMDRIKLRELKKGEN